jgi:hypothetical protein
MSSDILKALTISAATAALVAGAIMVPALAQDALPPGLGMAETMKGCGGCHGIGQILTEKRSAEEWANTVTMMITNGAPVEEADFDKVVTYLATYFGTGPAPAPGAAPAMPADHPPVAPAADAPASGATQPIAGGTAPAATALAPPTPPAQ